MPCKRPRRAAERLSHSGCRARQFPHHRTLRFFRFQLSAALLVHSFLRFSFVRIRSWPCLSVSACRYSVAPENRQGAARWRVRPGISEDSAWIRLNRFEVSAPGVERFARARRPSWPRSRRRDAGSIFTPYRGHVCLRGSRVPAVLAGGAAAAPFRCRQQRCPVAFAARRPPLRPAAGVLWNPNA